MSHRIFSCHHRVSYAECTVGNHVYHSRLLDILERARGEFFRTLNCSLLELQEAGVAFAVTACELKFRAMARYDDLLTVELWLTQLGRARFSCAGRISSASGDTLFESVTHLGCTTREGRPRRLPAPLSEAIRDFVAPACDCGHPS
jgi:YbgC/YbaW family acyl-CoA thioester hydrolase